MIIQIYLDNWGTSWLKMTMWPVSFLPFVDTAVHRFLRPFPFPMLWLLLPGHRWHVSRADYMLRHSRGPNRIWSRGSVCPCWSPSFGREVSGSDPRCCALQQGTSRLNSVNGYQECQNEPTDQRGPSKHQIHDTYSMWEIGMEFRAVVLKK